MQCFTIYHDHVTIPVSRGGRGRSLILCPGLSSTQAELHELTELLRRDYDVVTFDFRGHGLASAAEQYSFAAFLSDLTAVIERLELRSAPVLTGYSMGADLVVHYASEHPDSIAELVLIDGANPLPEPFMPEADLAEFLRALLDDPATQQEIERNQGTARQVLLSTQDKIDLNFEIDLRRRSTLLGLYRRIDRPISMIMSRSMAGPDGDEPATRINQLWRAGIERLVREQPDIATSWLEADHRLVITHAAEIAQIIRNTRGPATTIPTA